MPRGLVSTATGLKHRHLDPWSIETGVVSGQPSSTSVIPVSDTAELIVGDPIKWVQGATTGYGIITARVVDTSITIAGLALAVSTTIDEFYFGDPERVVPVICNVTSTYADGSDSTLLASDMNAYLRWPWRPAYLVAFAVRQKTDDSGTQPAVTPMLDGAAVSTENANTGPTLVTNVWTNNSAVAINGANYKASFRSDIELATTAGGTGDAADLTVELTFVFE